MGDKDIVLSGLKRNWEATSPELQQELGKQHFDNLFTVADLTLDISNPEVHWVVNGMIRAVRSKSPPAFLRIGRPLELITIRIIEMLPEEFADFFYGLNVHNLRILGVIRRLFGL